MSERAGLSGSFELVCAAHPQRGTFVVSQAFSAPLHLSKTYWDGDILLVNVVNQTAGWFGGDRVKVRVTLEPGARVLLSSPSAARFHPSEGREVRLAQSFQVAAGAFLDIFPELSIPQAGSCSSQATTIDVARGGELLFLETLAPGRVASGESFAFSRYAWRTEVRWVGRLVHRERAALDPAGSSVAGLRALFPVSYYASLIVISPSAEAWGTDFARAVGEMDNEDAARIGASPLSAGGWSIRVLAGDGLALRQVVTRIRTLIYQRLGKPLPDARRL